LCDNQTKKGKGKEKVKAKPKPQKKAAPQMKKIPAKTEEDLRSRINYHVKTHVILGDGKGDED